MCTMAGRRYHTFLSHNGDDKPAVEELAHRLRGEGIEPWLDTWNLIPGDPWQEAIEEAIAECDTCAVFVGPGGIGPWQHEEMRDAIDRCVADAGRRFRVIPVLLPGAERGDRSLLPRFLVRATWVEFRRSLDDEDALHRLKCGIRGIAPGPGRNGAIDVGVCPYQGLKAFDRDQARFFFGREGLTGWLVDALRQRPGAVEQSRFLAILGPSGSGKSSLARAGLLPAIERGDIDSSSEWPIVVLRPGPRPVESLAVALAANPAFRDHLPAVDEVEAKLDGDERALHLSLRVALHEEPEDRRVVLLVDQFEEVFTLCEKEELRRAFIANLLYASSVTGGRTIVVLTMRTDFYSRCAAYTDLAAALSAHQELVGPMNDEELRNAIEQPAFLTGCELEPGLTDALVNDVEGQAGALPLLEHTLLELWEGRVGRKMSFDRYREIGGIKGALERKAEEIFATFDPEEQDACRRLFLRLTQPGEGTEDTKRKVPRRELLPARGDPARLDSLLLRLAAADSRLITTEGEAEAGYVEVAHEALIREWSRLRQWIEAERGDLKIHRQLTAAADEWRKNGRDRSDLYRGRRLEELEDWAQGHAKDESELEREFRQASVRKRAGVTWAKRSTVILLAAALVGVTLWAVSSYRARAEEKRRGADLGLLVHLENEVRDLRRWPPPSVLRAVAHRAGGRVAEVLDDPFFAAKQWRRSAALLVDQAAEYTRAFDDLVKRKQFQVERNGVKTHQFESAEDQAEYERLRELVLGIAALQIDPPGRFTLGKVPPRFERLRWAAVVLKEFVASERLWRNAIEVIRTSPKYRGLEIPPQVGMIPMRSPNAESGLYEFRQLLPPHSFSRSDKTQVDEAVEVPPPLPVSGTGNDDLTGAQQQIRNDEIVLVLLPGGEFSMGSPESEDDRETNEKRHEVTLSPFFIAKHEVTQEQWFRVHGTESSFHKGPHLPVDTVSWDDCQEFCARAVLQLPSEAQWEYACRAGTLTRYSSGESEARLAKVARYKENSGGEPHGVGGKLANRFGLHDMHGNVWEWCEDGWDADFYSKPEASEKDPLCRPGSVYRVLRGGGWFSDARRCRSSFRSALRALVRNNTVGFRPARSLR